MNQQTVQERTKSWHSVLFSKGEKKSTAKNKTGCIPKSLYVLYIKLIVECCGLFSIFSQRERRRDIERDREFWPVPVDSLALLCLSSFIECVYFLIARIAASCIMMLEFECILQKLFSVNIFPQIFENSVKFRSISLKKNGNRCDAFEKIFSR